MPPDEMIGDANLDQVAASLLVKPEAKPVLAKKVEEKSTPEASADENPESEESDNAVNEEVVDEAVADEEPADSEAENEEEIDADEFEIDVTVDGEEKKVKLKDLKADYSGNKAIEKRLQEASEVRTKAFEIGKTLHSALQAEASRLAALDEIVKKVAEPEINWDELKRTNLPKYLLERDKQREAEDRRRAIATEQARVKAEQEKIEAFAHQEYTTEQAKKLVEKLPEFGDPVKAQATFGKLVDTAKKYGYAPEEVGSVIDHRAMLVLNDAMKYQELMAKQGKAQKTTAKPTALLRPSASKAVRPVTTAQKLQKALIAKAQSSGKVEDVAATLLIRKK